MIDKENISLQWINAVAKASKATDKILVERVIRALLLLEGLAIGQIPFVFKGGTALMLHLNSSKRLSIDIDIIVPEAIDNLGQDLEMIAEKQGFNRVEPQHRDVVSKAAYLSALIRHNATSIEKFQNPLQIEGLTILDSLNNKLNKLKKSNPEAFFYWYRALEIGVRK
jgi:Domain of unknown function (DUF1814).